MEMTMRTAFGARTEYGWSAHENDDIAGKFIVPVLETAIINIVDIGDRVEAECQRGGGYDEDSIFRGGKMVTVQGTVTGHIGKGYSDVIIKWDDGHETFTDPVPGKPGFPVSNLRIAK
jgi:hypothetical protein